MQLTKFDLVGHQYRTHLERHQWWRQFRTCSFNVLITAPDFHFLGPFEEAVRGHRFTSDDEIKKTVLTWVSFGAENFLPPRKEEDGEVLQEEH